MAILAAVASGNFTDATTWAVVDTQDIAGTDATYLDSETNIGVLNSQPVQVSARVRKETSYNGNAPRLVQKANPALGLNSDIVLAIATLANGNWETLTGFITPADGDDGAFEVVIDCDGPAGYVNVDKVSFSA